MVCLMVLLAYIPPKYKLIRIAIIVSCVVGPFFFFIFGPGKILIRLLLTVGEIIDEDLLLDGTRLCPHQSPWLIGEAKIDLNVTDLNDVERRLNVTGLEAGGRHRPADCRSRHKVAVIIPYRDHDNQLPVLLNHLHPFLQRQQLDYAIFVIEQSNTSDFNRGMLMNIGFMEALGTGQFYKCIIFHDVNLLPENDFNIYSCPENGRPRQLVISSSHSNYRVMERNHLRGVTAVSTGDFARINGFSNMFWGGSGEDEDFYHRITYHDMTVVRYPKSLGRYMMVTNRPVEPSPDHQWILRNDTRQRSQFDGLVDLSYTRIDRQFNLLYTHIVVDIHQNTTD